MEDAVSRTSSEAWERYEHRVPGVTRARRSDPMYAAQVSLLRQWLDLTDMVMEDNGVDHNVRRQVLNQLLYGAPNPYDAEARIEDLAAKAEELGRMMPSPFPTGWEGVHDGVR